MAFNTTLKHFTSSQELAPLWATGQNYLLNQLVLQNDIIYRCAIAHTSSASFVTDLGAGKWVAVSAAGAEGSKNYIENSNFEDNNTTGWSTFSTTIDSTLKIPTGSITSDPTFTLAASGSTPLAGSYSLLASSGAVTITTTGYGFISSAFTIDREDQAKVMGFSFYYEAVSGTMNFSGTSANTFAVYIRDVSGGAWIQPAGVYNLTQSSGVGLCSGTFQTTATGTQYQIAVLMINTVSAGISLRFDDFQLGPQKVAYGSPVTDWQQYSPAASFVGFGAVSATNMWSRRVGDSLEVLGTFTCGTPTATTAQIPLGFNGAVANVTVDSSKAVSGVAVGVTPLSGSSSTNNAYHFLSAGAQSYVNMAIQGDTNSGIVAAQGSTLTGAGATLRVNFRVPISGWSSSVQMSNDTDTRVVAAVLSGSQSLAQNGVNFTNFTASLDTHGTAQSTKYVIPVSGVYSITAVVRVECQVNAGGIFFATVYKNATGVVTDRFDASASALVAGAGQPITFTPSSLVECKAGDEITVYVYQQAGGSRAVDVRLSVHRLSGPATIAAIESVQAKFWASANHTTNATTPFNYDQKVYDSHGAVTTGAAWKFTAPISGKYQVNSFLNSSSVPASNVYVVIYKNGSALESIGYMPTSPGAATVAMTLEMNAGDYFDLRTNANYPAYGGGGSRSGSPCLITITKIGN